jgi:transcriptional regulator with PAS, ATPase and Fis domain
MTKPLVNVSCGSLTDTLLTSELFGHVKGAFTGAVRDQKGRFELARDGTLFLDEIDAIPLSLQKRLLRVLQEREFERVGEGRSIRVTARVIAASNQNLAKMVGEGEFRQDLYYRLNVIPITVPPLRERPVDVPALVEHFLDKYKESPMPLRVDEEVMEIFKGYSWPGNVRELENLVQQLVVFNREAAVGPPHLPHHIFYSQDVTGSLEPKPDVSLPDIVEEIEKKYILMGLKRYNWNRSLTASALGITRKMLSDRIKKYDISQHPKKRGNQ